MASAHREGRTVFRDVRNERSSGMAITLQYQIYPVPHTGTGSPIYHVSVAHCVTRAPTIRHSDGGTYDKSPESFESRYKLTSLTFEHARDLFAKLDSEVTARQLYRDPEFSLSDATRLVGTNELYLSQAINFFSGHSFSAYINTKRVDYIREHAGGRREGTPVWKIAGFGSYHAFYRYLRKHHGVTPHELLRGVLETFDLSTS